MNKSELHFTSLGYPSCNKETKNLPDINVNYKMSKIHDPGDNESINSDYAQKNVNNVVESLPYDP